MGISKFLFSNGMKYKVLRQNPLSERLFTLEDRFGVRYEVDFYTDGKFPPPDGVDYTEKSFREWLGTFVGKTLEIERIEPYYYFSSGTQKVCDETDEGHRTERSI